MKLSDYEPKKFSIGGSWLSEKYDGFRCLWLPHTRGQLFKDVFFANTARDDRNPVCSGLWTRRGKNIAAPDWWLDQLPLIPLDGELYLGRGQFQKVASVVRRLDPGEEWRDIAYYLFDSPGLEQFYKPRLIREGGRAKNPAYSAKFPWDAQTPYRDSPNYKSRRFNETLAYLDKHGYTGISTVAPQRQLPFSDIEATAIMEQVFGEVVDDGGEGLVLRRGHSLWEPGKSRDVVKVKPKHESEAQVIGYIMGKGKHEGRIGALRLSWLSPLGEKIFDLSGLTDEERALTTNCMIGKIGDFEPGNVVTTTSFSDLFPLGKMVKFVYNDLTADGMPKFARYKRVVGEDEENEVPDCSREG